VGQKLGQHFLNSDTVAKFIADAAELMGKETVVEVGPGKGMITKHLVASAKKVIAIENDKRLEPYLKDLGAEIVFGDVLETGFPKCDVVVSNVPFYISSQLVFSLPKVRAVLGLQKEFAEKMVAPPGSGNYGRLSVSSQIRFKGELLKSFPPKIFSPPPKVWLSVIRLFPGEFWDEFTYCENFIRKVFPYPNKSVNNALKFAGYSPDSNINKKVRELSPLEVISLAHKYS